MTTVIRGISSVLLIIVGVNAQTVSTHFTGSQVFDGARFTVREFYAEGGVIRSHPTKGSRVDTVDLAGKFVVPPYADAHEHNFDDVKNTPVDRQAVHGAGLESNCEVLVARHFLCAGYDEFDLWRGVSDCGEAGEYGFHGGRYISAGLHHR